MKPYLRISVLLGVGAVSALGQSTTSPDGDAVAARTTVPAIGFRTVVVCEALTGGYQVTVADMNGDRRPDILALNEQPGAVQWFENPGNEHDPWPRHPVTGTWTRRNTDLAVNDIDGDGQIDVALASDFDMRMTDEGGTLSWAYREEPGAAAWSQIRIDAEPGAHRIRWADVDGDGRKELITTPLAGPGAKLPASAGGPARVVCHWVSRDPVHESWSKQLIDQSLAVVHGMCIIDWDGDGRDDLLTASDQGVHLFRAQGSATALRWVRQHLAAGRPGAAPNCGSSEVAVGHVRNGARFIVAIEPWHGNEVVVYTASPVGSGELWQRQVIDDSLQEGHALTCADFDGDGGDEIVAGYRGKSSSLLAYRLVAGGSNRWERFVIDDGGMPAQGCVTADVNGDGRVDVVATGGGRQSVKLYLNATRIDGSATAP